MTKNKGLKCYWAIEGVSCGGPITKRTLTMDGNIRLRLTLCSEHLKHHKYIMFLNRNGYDVGETLNQTPGWREQEAQKLIASGILMTKKDI